MIMGCMFAGKTTELIRRCHEHEMSGKNVLILKFAADKRYGDDITIVTHSGIKASALAMDRLADFGNKFLDYDVIGVDEGQFFEDTVEFAEKVASHGKIVIVSSLQGTFKRGPFHSILNLIPKCEEITKLSAICKLCKHPASFTFRTASQNNQCMIGGEDMYMPLCRECHERETKKQGNNTF